MNELTLAGAYLLDLICGDPRWFPHPIKLIGYTVTKLEIIFYPGRYKRLAGVLLVSVVVAATFFISWLLIDIARTINSYAGLLLAAVFIYTTLSVKDLKDESMAVYHALNKRDIQSARNNLAMIVGRDTHTLDENEIIRATVETVAENIVDGIISPLFYAFIGGAPLALGYKAINTMDSMIGYKNERYKEFGWAAARLDDAANFIPARLAGLLLPVAVLVAGKSPVKSFRIMLRDGQKNPSPNSGISEAAVAGALGVRLGGVNFYNSIPVAKPSIGDELYPLDKEHIKDSIRIAYLVSFLFLLSGIVLLRLIARR
jgi:adenosylcobinamide-phosphate synthase